MLLRTCDGRFKLHAMASLEASRQQAPMSTTIVADLDEPSMADVTTPASAEPINAFAVHPSAVRITDGARFAR